MNYWPNVKLLILIFALILPVQSWGQESKIVDFEADITDFDQDLGRDVFRLLGNVTMRHKDIVLTCDSAYLNQETNRFKGYSRIHIIGWQHHRATSLIKLLCACPSLFALLSSVTLAWQQSP